VRPYHEDPAAEEVQDPVEDTIRVASPEPDQGQAPERGNGAPAGALFEESTQREIDSLIAQGVFEFVQLGGQERQGKRNFKSRIVNEVKNKITTEPKRFLRSPRQYNELVNA
jgi:hypothetical protein